MGIIGWIVLGLLAGIVAKAIFPGGERLGLILTTLLGIGGALLGGLVASLVGLGDPIDEFFDFSTWAAAIVGALAILSVRIEARHRRPQPAGVTFGRGVPTFSRAPGPACLRRWSTHTPGRGKTCRSRTVSVEEASVQDPLDQPTVNAAHHGRALPGQVGERAAPIVTSRPSTCGSKPCVAEDACELRDGSSLGRRRRSGPS